jgi:hypothetical protein
VKKVYHIIATIKLEIDAEDDEMVNWACPDLLKRKIEENGILVFCHDTADYTIDHIEERGPYDEDLMCPGCGCLPGDGITNGCDDPDGCGFSVEVHDG